MKKKGNKKKSPEKNVAVQADMIEDRKAAAAEDNFWNFVKSPFHKKVLLWSTVYYVVFYLVLRYFVPQVDMYSDSHTYINAALQHSDLSYRPVGYAKFLNLVHGFSESANTVSFIQLLLFLFSLQFFYLTFRYFFTYRNKLLAAIATVCYFVTPVGFAVANIISSDALFEALTLIWFGSLIWIIKKPSWWNVLLQVISLYFAFSVRYNALYYIFITVMAVLLSVKLSTIKKIGIAAITVLVIGVTYNHQKTLLEEDSDVSVFSGFSGWQMGNNAIYIHAYTHVDPGIFKTPEEQRLNEIVQSSLNTDSGKVAKKIFVDSGVTFTSFIWDNSSPLKIFLREYITRNQVPYFQAWNQVSSIYNDYAITLIKAYPWVFAKGFLIPNWKTVLVPDPEVLEIYNQGNYIIPATTKQYFPEFESGDYLSARCPQFISLLCWKAPVIHCIFFFLSVIFPVLYLVKYKFRKESKIALFWLAFILMDHVFFDLTTYVMLRYEVIWFYLFWTFPIYFLDRIIAPEKEI